MATYDELFPNGDPNLKEPFAPIQPRALRGMGAQLGVAARRAIPAGGGDAELGNFDADLDKLMAGFTPPKPAGGGTSWTDPLKNFAAGVADVGGMAVGAAEYGSRQLLGGEDQSAVTSVLGAGRRALTGLAEDITQSMSPEAQDLLVRQMDTLDPQRTVWQNPVDAMRSIGYKFARSLPSTLVTLLPAARFFKAGMSPGAITYLGASEGGLSMGGISNNIAQEIEQMSEEELQAESPRYKELLAGGMTSGTARQALISEAQGAAPLVGGVAVGAISSVAGRYLEPIFSGAGAGLLGRAGRGFAAEAPQEASQSAVEQYVQNVAAQVYDLDRAAMEGVAGASLEGGVIGGLTGGAFSAVLGKRPEPPRQAIPPTPAPETPAEPPIDPAVAAAIRDSDLASQAEADLQGAPTMAYGQGEMFGPPPGQPDILPEQATLRDQFGYDPTRDAAQTASGEPMAFGGTDPAGFALRQNQFQFTYGEPPAPPPPPAVPEGGIQYPLGLRDPVRRRGVPPQIITPTPSTPMETDMSAPPGFSNERLPVDMMPAGRRPTQADFLRQKEETDRRDRYAGTVMDENQLDMFAPPPGGEPPGPPPGGGTAAQQPFGFVVRGRNDAGETVYEEIFETREEANADLDANTLNEQGELKQQDISFSVEPLRAGPRAQPVADQPSLEPYADIEAQLDDLADPDNPRKGVYLSRDNIANLRRLGVLDQVRSRGVPLMNFDLRGGTLIAKDRRTADAALTMRKQGVPMQEILGIATGAGRGKPAGLSIVVQQRDEAGNVTRESGVATEEEADQLAAKWEQEDPTRDVTILRVDAAIKRRTQRAQKEGRQLEAQKEAADTRRKVSRELLPLEDTEAAEEARRRVNRDPALTPERAARAIVQTSRASSVDETLARVGRFDRPDMVRFEPREDVAKTVVDVAPGKRGSSTLKRRREQFDRMLAYWKKRREELRKTKKSKSRTEYEAARAIYKREHDKWAKKYLRPRTATEMRKARAARSEKINAKYRNAFEKYQESSAEVARLSKLLDSGITRNRENLRRRLEAAEKERRSAEKTLQSFYKMYRVESTATDLARTAERLSRSEVLKIRAAARENMVDRSREEKIDDLTPMTVEEIDNLSEGEVDEEFLKAANFLSGLRPARKRDLDRRAKVAGAEGSRINEGSVEAAFDTEAATTDASDLTEMPNVGVVAGRTLDEYVTAYTRTSEKLKIIKRAQRLLNHRQRPAGKVRRKFGHAKLDLTPLINETDSKQEREATAKQRAENAKTVEKAITGLNKALTKGEKLLAALQKLPDNPRNMFARAYLRSVQAAGKALAGSANRTLAAAKLADKISEILNGVTSGTQEEAVKQLARWSGLDEKKLEALNNLKQGAFEKWLAGDRKPMAKLMRALDREQFARFIEQHMKQATVDNMKRYVGEAAAKNYAEVAQELLNNLTAIHNQWLDTAYFYYERNVRPVMMNMDEGRTSLSPRDLNRIRTGLHNMRAGRYLGLEAERALRRIDPENPRLAYSYAPTLELLVEPLTAKLKQMGFTFDENGEITGWSKFGRDDSVMPESAEFTEMRERLPGEVAASIAEGVRRTERETVEAQVDEPAQSELFEPTTVSTETPRTKMVAAFDRAIEKLMKKLDEAAAPGQVVEAEQWFFDHIRRLGVWQKDGIADSLPSGMLSYNNRVGPRLQRKQITMRQAITELQQRLVTIGSVRTGSKVVSETVPADSLAPSVLPYRPDITPQEFRKLPPEERAKIRKARLDENRRRANMTPEARKILERMERKGIPMSRALNDFLPSTPAEDAAAKQIRALLFERPTQARAYQLLRAIQNELGAGHPLGELAGILLRVPSIQGIKWELRSEMLEDGALFAAEPGGEMSLAINSSTAPGLSSRELLHVVLHETVHAATMGELANNRQLREQWESLRQRVQSAVGKKADIPNVYEFVSEVFSNAEFQKLLKQTPAKLPFWKRVVDFVRRMLGASPRYSFTFDEIVSLRDKTMSGRLFDTRGQQVYFQDTLKAKVPYTGIKVVDDVIDQFATTREARAKLQDAAISSKEAANSGVLAAMTIDQIRDFFAPYFEGGDRNPLNAWHEAFSRRNADNSKSMEEVDKISRAWTELKEAFGVEQEQEFSRLMTEATIHEVHPDLPITHAKNAHLTHPNQKAKHAELQQRFSKLDPKWHLFWARVRDHYSSTLEEEQSLAVLNALRAYLTTDRNSSMTPEEFSRRYKEGSVKEKKLNTKKGLRAEFPEELLSDEAVTNITKLGAVSGMYKGPYFPLTRVGKYVVYAEKLVSTKTFNSKEAAREYQNDLMTSDPTLEVKITSENGVFTAEVREKEYRQAETPSEAMSHEAEMVEKYGRKNVTPVQLKETLFTSQPSIPGPQGLRSLLDKLGDNAAAKAAIKDFYLRSLADNSFRKHERKRLNRRGVNPEMQHRAFGIYAKAASYYKSQLRYGWRMAQAKREIDAAAKAHRDESQITTVRMQQIARELRLRDEMSVDPNEVSKLVKGSSELSQFMLLTTASYWLINMSQPYMVTLPWLAAKSSAAEAGAALVRAQKLVARPIVEQAIESRAGLKALISKAASERAFTVLEQVEDSLKLRLGEAKAKPYLDMLTELKRNSVIDLSFVAELRDIAEGVDTGPRRVLDASRIMAHLTEVNNRIVTAIAAYDLALKKGLDHDQATEYAKEAVSKTQFNYSGANAPRLFQAEGPMGRMGPIMFQFMKYPQHLYALMVGGILQATRGDANARRTALRMLGGLALTHYTVGGLIGVFPQPLKWVLGMIIMAANDEDDRAQDVLSGELFDRTMREWTFDLTGSTDMGRLLSAGVPAALGTDMSSRMSLGTLYFVDMKPENAESFFGSLFLSFGGPIWSILVNAAKAPGYFAEGEYAKAGESVAPKFLKDLARVSRFAEEGMTTRTGAQLVGPDEFTTSDLVLQGLGFQPTRVGEKYAAGQAIRVRSQAAKDRRTKLMQRFINADSPEERNRVLADISAFVRENPAEQITRADLLRAMVRRNETNFRTRAFGADLRGDDVLYAEEANPYEME